MSGTDIRFCYGMSSTNLGLWYQATADRRPLLCGHRAEESAVAARTVEPLRARGFLPRVMIMAVTSKYKEKNGGKQQPALRRACTADALGGSERVGDTILGAEIPAKLRRFQLVVLKFQVPG
eukprot:2835703-Rhodomonas_salina.1